MKSTLIPKSAMEIYLEGQDKLKVALKKISLEDHRWSLKSWDENNVGIIKIICHECPREMEGTSRMHQKNNMNNMFSNFKKNHVGTAAHVKRFCKNRGLDFNNHPQSQARDG